MKHICEKFKTKHVTVSKDPRPLTFVVLLFISSLCGAQQPVDTVVSDSEINDAVYRAFVNHPILDAHLLDITTEEGIVTISGTLDNLLQKDAVMRTSGAIRGVRGMIDHVTITQKKISDSDLRSDILFKVATDPAMGKFVPELKVREGVVTVEGTVPSHGQRELLINNVKSVRGVREIHDNLNVVLDNTRSDSQIEQEVRRRFELSPYIPDLLMRVDVVDGVVRLSGTVGSVHGMTQARRLASVAGVKSVDDSDLKVGLLARINRSVGREPVELSDSVLQVRIGDILRYDSRTSALPVGVSVEGGRVVLTGRAQSLAAKNAAEEDARNTVGVRSVKNLIRVRPESIRRDTEIAEDVRAVLAIDPLIRADEITVQVRNGNAHLYGKVGSQIDVARAGRVVSAVAGVSEITNRLRPMVSRPGVTDDELEGALEEAFLWSPYVDPEHVTAVIRDGIVTLEGRVTSWRQLYTAVRLSLEAGAVEVRSRLVHEGVSEYFPVFHYEDYSYWR